MAPVPRAHLLFALWLISLAIGATAWLHDASDRSQPTVLITGAEKPAPASPALSLLPSHSPLGLLPADAAVKAWGMNRRDAFLSGEPDETAPALDVLPADSYVKVLRTQADWLQIAYSGERGLASPTIAWARHLDLESLAAKPRWVKTYESAKLWPSAESDTPLVASVPRWSWLELTGEERRGRFAVRTPGDGRTVLPGHGWIDATAIVPASPPTRSELPRGYPANTEAGAVRIAVPYRTQLDDTPWAAANCGPTALSMALEYLGKSVSSAQVRRTVLAAQNLYGDDSGVFIWALAASADRYGARALDYNVNGAQHRWSTDDVRFHLERNRPVILQVAYRALPGREEALYGGDHYVIVTGLIGESFLYHDPVDSDGVGYDRVMTDTELDRAMRATDRRYANSGFALARAS